MEQIEQLKELIILSYLYKNEYNKIKITKNKNRYDIKINNKILFKIDPYILYIWIRLNNNILFNYKIKQFKNSLNLRSYLDKNINKIYYKHMEV